MIKVGIFFLSFLLNLVFSFSQDCERFLSTDSVNVIENSYIKVPAYKSPFEDGQMQMALMSVNGKYYLKIYTFKILYFDLISSLEIISENMSIVFKDVKLFKADHQKGVFILNVQKNYVTTLKNHGITEIIFNNLKESIPKKTSKIIRQVSSCFLNQINNQ